MEVLPERVKSRRANYEFYRAHLGHIKEIEFLHEPQGFYSNRWLTCILTSSFEEREMIRLALLEEDIESRPLWKPMHLQPVFENALHFSDGTSEDLFARGLCLPSGSNLEREDLERIVSLITKKFAK
jgi:dTDP-4-amino-4,6-dideoxygalactose transaminase